MPEPLTPGLYLVATPIGNRQDLSFRALEIFGAVQAIFCEDTRHTRKLLTEHPVTAQLIPCHEHNEQKIAQEIVDRIQQGQAIALVSDAGTPAISDPGFRAVRACRAHGLPVTGVPGPNAAVHALALSGLPSDRFLFLGFLPPKKSARISTFTQFAEFEATLILYESTHRILKFLDDLETTLGPDRTIAVMRELTKHFESIHVGPICEVRPAVEAASTKGEFVVLIAKAGYTLR